MLPCSRTPCAHRRSFLQQPCAHRRSCLQQPCAHSSCTHRPSSSLILSSIVRSSTLELENVLRSSLLVHAHARERLACVLRSSTLPVRSLARERLALIVALACNSPELTHRPSIVAHAYEASSAHIHAHARERLAFISSHYRRTCLQQPFTHRSSRWLSLASVLRSPRSSSRTSCVRCAIIALLVVAHVLHVENALRGLRSIICNMLPCSRTPCVHRRSFNPATALRSSSLFCLQQTSSALIVAHPIKHRAFIHYSSTLKLENFLHTRRCVSSTSSASVYRCSVC